jgi:S1-C subfamily serine protease
VREAAIAQAKPAVVEIQGRVPQGIALGSGVIIDQQGNIVTNNHVVSGATALTVTLNDGTQLPARLVGSDLAQDLAIIHIQPVAQMTVATPGDSAQLSVGQEVLAIGSPLGYNGTVTVGVVSALNRDVDEARGVRLSGLIQTSAAINPGNSGGALINLQGQFVGIPTLSALNNETNTPAEGIGFAIPSNTVLAVVARIVGK